MDKNVLWYKNKRVEELSKVLLDKEYLIHCVESLEEGKERRDKKRFFNSGDSYIRRGIYK